MGPAAWNVILPRNSITKPLDENRTADCTIIGAGFAGLSAARRLLELDPNCKIVLLEAGEIGEGASGRNTGFMIDLPHELNSSDYSGLNKSSDRNIIEINRSAITFAKEAAEEYHIDKNYFDPAGKINGAASERGHKSNVNYGSHLSKLSEQHELLDSKQMEEITGSSYYVSGLYTPGTAMLQPAGYVRDFARGLRKKISIYENSPVLSFDRQGANWNVNTQSGIVSTGCVILANNGHLESFGFMQNRLMHIFLFATMTKELDYNELKALGGQSRWGITPSDPMGCTLRRIDTKQGGNRIITRTCAEFRPDMLASVGNFERSKKIMNRKFEDRFPKLRGIAMEHTWAGHLCLSKNSVSVTGKLDDGVYAACCQNGLGTARGTSTGICVAEQVSGFKSQITDYFQQEDMPSKLPPPPISTIGANAYLRYKEHKASQE